MIKEYAMFYEYVKKHDVLVVVFNYGNIATRYERKGDIGVVYSGTTPIAYNFFQISKILKIRARGMIYLPSEPLVDLLNALLRDYEKLDYKKDSGYQIVIAKEIINKDEKKDICHLEYKIGEVTVCLLPKDMVKVGDRFVLAKQGVMLPSGIICKRMSACSDYDLGINEDKNHIYTLDDLYMIGTDFFRMEEN